MSTQSWCGYAADLSTCWKLNGTHRFWKELGISFNPSNYLFLTDIPSKFIECLGNDKTMGLAKDQLDGFTQSLTTYCLNNVQEIDSPDSPNICFIDMPGFADSKLPESKMLRLLLEEMKA